MGVGDVGLNNRRVGYLVGLVLLLTILQKIEILEEPDQPEIHERIKDYLAYSSNGNATNETRGDSPIGSNTDSFHVHPASEDVSSTSSDTAINDTRYDSPIGSRNITFNLPTPSENACEQQNNGESTLTQYPTNYTLKDIVNITQRGPLRPRKKVICVFERNGNYLHFPHVYQQFTRCFSFFQSFPKHKPYIVRTAHHRFRDTFNAGVWQIFRDIFKGTITTRFDHVADNHSVVANALYGTGYEEGPYQGIAFADPTHAETLRQKTAAHHNMTFEGCRPSKDFPVIRILNREIASNRSLLNAEALRGELSNMTDAPVDIAYFEGKEFLEQLEFMMQTDILISPHGAQLTSVNFMPECGGVVELFPPGFWFPHFFGPLAASSGLSHGYIYTGVNHIKEWKWGGLRHRSKRFEVRNRQVCLHLEHSLPLIVEMVDNWKRCCRDKLPQEGSLG